jgi:hypothetical protein
MLIQKFMDLVRQYLELAYFASGIVIAFASIIGLRQLRLLKADIITRNVRAAREKAIEASSRYLTETVTASNKVYFAFKTKKLPTNYEGDIGDFSLQSLPTAWHDEAGSARLATDGILDELNSLEIVAAMFTSGVADSETGVKIIGRSFCGAVESRYDLISYCRHRENTDYDYCGSIVSLYKVWSSKFSSEELAKARKDIDSKMARMASARLDRIEPKV